MLTADLAVNHNKSLGVLSALERVCVCVCVCVSSCCPAVMFVRAVLALGVSQGPLCLSTASK